MNIVVNTSSMIPIYEQIVYQVKKMIISGELQENDPLPSVRSLARDLKISALTVKKAYDQLEEEGLTATVHGKGSYVRSADPGKVAEERRKEIEEDLSALLQKANAYGVSPEEIREMLDILTEE